MLSFFSRDVLDEILNLIESVSEGFPSYSFKQCGINDKQSLQSEHSLVSTINGIGPTHTADNKASIDLGPVVQSIVSLTSSLRGQLVKCFTTL